MIGTYLVVDAPDGVGGQARDSTVSSADGVEFNAEREFYVAVIGVDVDNLADGTEDLADALSGGLDRGVRAVGELPVCVIGVGLDLDGDLDLALELVDLGAVLAFGEGVRVGCDVFGGEALQLEDALGLRSVAEVVELEHDTVVVGRDACVEARILEDSQQGQ